MSHSGVLAIVLAMSACVAVLLAALGISILRRVLLRRREPALAAGRAALVEITVTGHRATGIPEPPLPPALSSLRRGELIMIIMAVAPSVSGNSLAALRMIAHSTGVAGDARRRLRSRRWSRRLTAARLLAAIGAEMTLDDRPLFHDHRAIVRAQAATWAATSTDPALVGEVVALLADQDGRCRFAAKDTLVRIGIRAVSALSKLLDSTDPTGVTAALEVATAVGHPRYVTPALRIATADCPVQRALAATVLGACGDPAATPVLRRLLADPDPGVRRAAARAIAELGDWPAAATVAELLEDESWAVRREAGMALLRLSAPGLVLLREATRGVGPAAEVAIHALQLSELAAPASTAPGAM